MLDCSRGSNGTARNPDQAFEISNSFDEALSFTSGYMQWTSLCRTRVQTQSLHVVSWSQCFLLDLLGCLEDMDSVGLSLRT